MAGVVERDIVSRNASGLQEVDPLIVVADLRKRADVVDVIPDNLGVGAVEVDPGASAPVARVAKNVVDFVRLDDGVDAIRVDAVLTPVVPHHLEADNLDVVCVVGKHRARRAHQHRLPFRVRDIGNRRYGHSAGVGLE